MQCQDCSTENPVWFAPSPLWNLGMGGPDAKDDPGGIICPNCFIKRAEAAGQKPTAWVVLPEHELDALKEAAETARADGWEDGHQAAEEDRE